MASLVVIFPVGKETSADGYLDFVNTNNPDSGDFYDVRFDRHGQRVVAYMGPGGFVWNSEPYPEPEGGEEARADGVLQEGYDAVIDPEDG
jgi:hypothetical protein